MRSWSVETGQLLQTLEGHCDRVKAVCYSSDGMLAASASDDKNVKLWNMEAGLRT